MTQQPEALRLADELRHWRSPDKEAAAELRRLHEVNQELLEALKDMNSGWKYIRHSYGDLYGVGWDRAQGKADAAIAKMEITQGKQT
tara:strand:- start:1720 stop:1980 length:261 start_codon:yes stop_codon:yes gene_type:complete